MAKVQKLMKRARSFLALNLFKFEGILEAGVFDGFMK